MWQNNSADNQSKITKNVEDNSLVKNVCVGETPQFDQKKGSKPLKTDDPPKNVPYVLKKTAKPQKTIREYDQDFLLNLSPTTKKTLEHYTLFWKLKINYKGLELARYQPKVIFDSEYNNSSYAALHKKIQDQVNLFFVFNFNNKKMALGVFIKNAMEMFGGNPSKNGDFRFKINDEDATILIKDMEKKKDTDKRKYHVYYANKTKKIHFRFSKESPATHEIAFQSEGRRGIVIKLNQNEKAQIEFNNESPDSYEFFNYQDFLDKHQQTSWKLENIVVYQFNEM